MAQATHEQDDVRSIAQETMIGDLIQTTIDELKAAPDVWQKLSEEKQGDVIERLEKRIQSAVAQAIHILATDDRPALNAHLDQITIKDDVKAVLKLRKGDPAALDLFEAAGEDVLIVLPHLEQYSEQPAGVEPEPDQPGLELDEDNVVEFSGGKEDPLLQSAIDLVVEAQKCSISQVQRGVRVGYNRAAQLVERMEALGVVSPMNDKGQRVVQQAGYALEVDTTDGAYAGQSKAAEQRKEEVKASKADDRHPYYSRAVEVAATYAVLSVDDLAEEMELSGWEAAKLIAQLEADGVIGPANEHDGHEVLVLGPGEGDR